MKINMRAFNTALTIFLSAGSLYASEYHVAVSGDDGAAGSSSKPFKTISAAAQVAQPGDVITVHEGLYREQVSPPRGGESDKKRIVYQAAPGEKVEIKGSEVVRNWKKVQSDTWKVTIKNSFFGSFNPFSELIQGDWFNGKGRLHHAGAVYLNGDWLTEAVKRDEALKPAGDTPLWFAEVDADSTTIWAQFKGVDPNKQLVEVNARRTVFYPENPGMNYITVRGFTMRHAATPWAPPTVEQVGLIGTHWSKGWIIENNIISHSTCCGVTLGKYGEKDDSNTGSAKGYVNTIERGIQRGWNKAAIGGHLVRNNTISHCEQAGIVGSLGGAFSRIIGNTIHDIHVRGLFSGAEMAGIKLHGPIDVEISRNHIYRTCRGIWLDWMSQGTRVSGNLLHDNAAHDLFVEVNHGPFLVDNNLFLSSKSLEDDSQGGAYIHNLIAGGMSLNPDLYDGRKTPFHKPHSTEVVALHDNPSGDSLFYNNLLVQGGDLSPYDKAQLPTVMSGNVFLKGTKPCRQETGALLKPDFDPALKLVENADGLYLEINLDKSWGTERRRKLVTTELLGKAMIPDQAFENPDGTPLQVDTDYFGKKRDKKNPFPGPFEISEGGKQRLKVWETVELRKVRKMRK